MFADEFCVDECLEDDVEDNLHGGKNIILIATFIHIPLHSSIDFQPLCF